MRHRYLFLLALAAALAGCSAGEETTGLSSTASDRQSAAASVPGVAASAAVGPGSSIASMPDRGELMRYSAPRPTSGATAPALVPVAISEEHAFAAIHRKQLVLEAPDGVRSRVAYARHQDHGDGNWTWIGHDEAGRSALLTFGQNAVFGSIQRADGSELRIVTQQRRTYAIVVRPDQLRGVETSTGSDALVVSDSAVAQAAARRAEGAQTTRAASAGAVEATAAAANEIDVLLGYSAGLAQRIGSASGAETRMQNLVAISNEGYQNSGVAYRIRLVGALQVAYGDGTRNDSALHALTGSNGSGSSPIDPAFTALRNARAQTGADLVSFVRQFRDPEQDGCGIAWLLGGGQTTIDQADASFAYSVVSDGSDINEADGKTYFCREETLAHELGHNMGQAHNSEDSTSTGAHAYSYAYREASTTGFYTIMAYRIANSSQFAIRHFANPGVLYQGRPTGVANQSDNVRSMNQTMPIIASFRASTVPQTVFAPPSRDVDGNGRDDIVWYQPTTRELYHWFMNGATPFIRSTGGYGPAGMSPLTVADPSGDRYADVLFGNGTALVLYSGNGAGGYSVASVGNQPAGYRLLAAADVDGNGRSDLIWHNTLSGALLQWRMNGAAVESTAAAGSVIGGTVPLGVGDTSGDGRAEILLGSTEHLYMLLPSDTGYSAVYVSQRPLGYNLVAIQDADANGRADLIWYQPQTRELYVWLMNGSIPVGGYVSQAVFGGTAPIAFADYNGDRRFDVLLSSGSNVYVLISNGVGTFAPSYVSAYPAGWVVQ